MVCARYDKVPAFLAQKLRELGDPQSNLASKMDGSGSFAFVEEILTQ